MHTSFFVTSSPRTLNGMLNIPHEKPEEETKKTATVFLLPAAKFFEGPAVGVRFCRILKATYILQSLRSQMLPLFSVVSKG